MAGATHSVQMHRADLGQVYLLDQDSDPDCLDDLRQHWVLPAATLVRPRVDFRRLSRAAEKLLARHDCLRIRFDRIRGKWMAIIDPPGPPQIRQIDLGDMDDVTFRARITEIANAPMPLLGNRLAELVVVHCGTRGDVIVSRVHHAVTDGFGMVVLTEDLMKYLIGMPVLTRAVSHADYIAKFEDPPPGRAAEFTAFWERMHRDFPPAPLIGRKAKGLEPLWRGTGKVEARLLTVSASAKSLTRLEARADRLGLGLATVLFSGYLEALCQIYDMDQLMFVTHVARTNPALDTYVGDHTLDPVTRYRAAGPAGLDRAARDLNATLMAALEHLPHEAARRGTAWEDEIIAAGGYPGQISAYQPRAMSRQDRSVFSEGFKRGYGVEQRMGPYWVSSVDVGVYHRSLAEQQFSLGADNGRSGFILRYDGIAYDEGEMPALAEKICDLLDLDLTGMAGI
mgnify:CR=1 FL=1